MISSVHIISMERTGRIHSIAQNMIALFYVNFLVEEANPGASGFQLECPLLFPGDEYNFDEKWRYNNKWVVILNMKLFEKLDYPDDVLPFIESANNYLNICFDVENLISRNAEIDHSLIIDICVSEIKNALSTFRAIFI